MVPRLMRHLKHYRRTLIVQMHNHALPVEILREFLPYGMTVGEVAARLGVSRPHLSKLLNCHTSMVMSLPNRPYIAVEGLIVVVHIAIEQVVAPGA